MLASYDNLFYTALYVLPGFAAYHISESIINNSPYFSGRRKSEHFSGDMLLLYLLYSLICNLLCSLALGHDWAKADIYLLIPAEAAAILLVSAAVGFGFRLLCSRMDEFPEKLARLILPNRRSWVAWDRVFADIKYGSHLIVYLSNGEAVLGKFGPDSRASGTERDLYLEKAYYIEKDKKWREIPDNQGVFINPNSILYIEFYKLEAGKEGDADA